MTDPTPLEQAEAFLEIQQFQRDGLTVAKAWDADHGEHHLTYGALRALAAQVKLDAERLATLRRRLDAAEAADCGCGGDGAFWADLNRDLADPRFRAAYEEARDRIRAADAQQGQGGHQTAPVALGATDPVPGDSHSSSSPQRGSGDVEERQPPNWPLILDCGHSSWQATAMDGAVYCRCGSKTIPPTAQTSDQSATTREGEQQ